MSLGIVVLITVAFPQNAYCYQRQLYLSGGWLSIGWVVFLQVNFSEDQSLFIKSKKKDDPIDEQ
jgi:hypothetical protein